ncbi:hypothetical protein GALMADRAFT_680663 [Galerina marginata CBS 339.88]|uniref:RRM domain-containing protein n=1 Tax=Galerina marginata (strain CBS 339.88) TaxID=685588 RepID=A0A067TXS9_GALM3|nr:hypothetical protein GALMADRAFT_680663 [Galerina marginata CBS 339.88]
MEFLEMYLDLGLDPLLRVGHSWTWLIDSSLALRELSKTCRRPNWAELRIRLITFRLIPRRYLQSSSRSSVFFENLPRTSMPHFPSRQPSKRLYIRGLTNGVSEEDLLKYLSCYGMICEVKLLPNYAFVQFESEKDSEAVLQTFRGQPLLGRDVVIEFAHPLRKDMSLVSSADSSSKSRTYTQRSSRGRFPVVVMDIPRNICWQELKDFGRLSGRPVAYCDLDKTQTGRGFIEYFTCGDARHAVAVLDGQRLGGRGVHVVDHWSFREYRNRSRSRSPTTHSTSDLTRNDNRPSRHTGTSRFERGSSSHRPSLLDQACDYLDAAFPSSTHPINARDQNWDKDEYVHRAFVDSETVETVQRVSTSWTAGYQDHCRGYDYHDRQYPYERFYDENPGYDWSNMSRNQSQRPLDAYQ